MSSAIESGAGQVVCFETFRRERQQRQARVLPYLAAFERRSPQSPFRGVQLTGREVEHRQRMLRHLAEEPHEGPSPTQ
jgi:hypothetical protein